MSELTPRQKEFYDYLVKRVVDLGSTPTLRDIMEEFGLASTNGVRNTLLALVKKGYVTEGRQGKARRFGPVMDRAGLSEMRIPIIGRVAAGAPVLTEESVTGYLNFGGETSVSSDSFVVVASDNALCGAGILTGDHVLIDPLAEWSLNDIVAVRKGGEILLRRLGPNSRLLTVGRTAVELIRKI